MIRTTVLLILVALPLAAQAQSRMWCDMIRMGAATMSQAEIDDYLRRATPTQMAEGRACLGLPAKFKAPRGKRAVKGQGQSQK